MSHEFLTDPLIVRLLALRLPPDDYAVFGSGPLLAHNLKPAVQDLDVLARGAAWDQAAKLTEPVAAPSGCGDMVELAGGRLQIFNAWTSPDWDTDRLIDEADVVAGMRFVTLPLVLAWKQQAGRPKDVDDVRILEAHLHG